MSLQIELKDWSGKKVFAHYDVFRVNNEKNNYKITVIGYNGTSRDSLNHHNNMIFSTRDRDNDMRNTGSYPNELTGDGGLTIVTTQIWTGSLWGTQKLTVVLAEFDLNITSP